MWISWTFFQAFSTDVQVTWTVFRVLSREDERAQAFRLPYRFLFQVSRRGLVLKKQEELMAIIVA